MAITLNSNALNARAFNGSVSRDAIMLPVDVSSWGTGVAATGTINVTLTVNSGMAGRNYAPHAIVVEATATNFEDEELSTPEWDASFHRLSYVHDSGDIHCGDFRWPERLNIKSRRYVHAKRSVHVYREPGTYTHTVFVYDRAGNWGSASTTVVIAEPSYDPNNVVVLAPDGDFDNAPYCLPANRVTTWAAMRARMTAIGTASGARLLTIKRGTTVTPDIALRLIDLDVSSWGPAGSANPVLNLPAGSVSSGTAFTMYGSRTKIQGVDTKGTWDPVSERGATDGSMASYLTNMTSGILLDGLDGAANEILVDLCDNENSSDTYIQSTGKFDGSIVVMHECGMKNFKNYFTFAECSPGSTTAMIGNKIEQHPQAASGGLERWFLNPEVAGHAGWYPNNAHSGGRFATAGNVLILGNDMFARHGWSTQNFDVYETNALIRLNSTGVLGARAWVVNNWIEGPVAVYNAAGGTVNWGSYVWEFNTHIMDPTASTCIGSACTGNTVRNSLFIAPISGGVDYRVFAAVSLGSESTNPALSRNEVYSNTYVDHAVEANHVGDFSPYKIGAGVQGFAQNNVYHAPNRTVPQVADGPLVYPAEVEGSLPAPRYLGRRKSYEYWLNTYTLPSAVAPGQSFLLPYRADRLGIMTSAASFSGNWGKHRIMPTTGVPTVSAGVITNVTNPGKRYGQVSGEINVTFEAGGIRIANNSDTTWPTGSGFATWLHRGTTAMAMDETSKVQPGSFDLGWLTSASGAYEDATTGIVGLLDLRGNPRPGSGHANAPAGFPSRGAYVAA